MKDAIDIRPATITRLRDLALMEFKRTDLSDDEAHNEAVSFAYAAAEILADRLDEHQEIGPR